MCNVKIVLVIIMLVFQHQDTSLKDFSRKIFTAIVNNDIKTIMQHVPKGEDFDQIEFYRAISDENKKQFRDNFLNSEEVMINKTQQALYEFKDKIMKSKIKSSDVKFIEVTEDIKELDFMNVSMGQIYITFLFEHKEEMMIIKVIKIKNKYMLAGSIEIL